MKIPTISIASLLVMTASLFGAQENGAACNCKDCKCTEESHCGCMSKDGCSCGQGCGCGERKCGCK